LWYPAPLMPDPLTLEEVRHVARLARLHLTNEELDAYRAQLSVVLDHIAKLNELDLSGVEPMAAPFDDTNRLDEDEVATPMPIQHLAMNAPVMKERFIAVPKVLGGTDEA
jgi:aspartyl-tRNA(Asn)/glutamyl-tRNA(Gln) amidotransferase subunit C